MGGGGKISETTARPTIFRSANKIPFRGVTLIPLPFSSFAAAPFDPASFSHPRRPRAPHLLRPPHGPPMRARRHQGRAVVVVAERGLAHCHHPYLPRHVDYSIRVGDPPLSDEGGAPVAASPTRFPPRRPTCRTILLRPRHRPPQWTGSATYPVSASPYSSLLPIFILQLTPFPRPLVPPSVWC